MPRVTRAQAEKELTLAQQVLLITATEARSGDCDNEADRAIAANIGLGKVRAYLAQRPDEDTVRKGHEALGAVFSTLEYHAPNETRAEAWERDIRAAMYQPEEEA